ncbi:MAG TPA: hypothetical protein IAB48_04500 [Candidatus Fimimorpha excrementavium]|nr:hypothetical protein [Candidatus Fimimorpha excrementavium]
MKKWYKILAICFVTMCMVLLGGCTKQAQLNSEMTVKEDGSGTRTIQIAMDKNLVKRGFKGSEKTLERLMDQYCPRELEWEVDERQSLYDLTLTLSFDTLDEYVEKAEALVGTKKIELKDTGQGLQVGFSLEENVTAEDFLDWLKDALVKERYIKRSEKEDLFRLEKTYFSYAGERRSVSNGKIRYQYQKEYDTEQIVMLTQPDTGEQWSRVIYLYFPSELMERREAQVREFVKDRISKDTQVKWLSKTCVCLTFPQADRYKLSQDMQSFFGQASCKIEETMEQNSTFSFGYQYQEYIDMEVFAPKTGAVPVYYYVKPSPDGYLTCHSDGGEAEDLALPDAGSREIQAQIAQLIETEGYVMVMGQSVEKEAVSYDMDYQYEASAIEVNNVMRDRDSISRSITVVYDRVPLGVHQNAILQDFETKVGQNGYVEILEDGGAYKVQVSQEGTWEELSVLFEAVYGGKDTVSYKRDKTTLLTPSAHGYMEENMDFSAFLPKGCEPQLTYEIQFESGDTILKDTLDSTALKMDQEQVIKSTRYMATVGGDGFHIKFTTQIKNLISMPLISLILFLIFAVLIWYLHGERWQRIMQKITPVYEMCVEKTEGWWERQKDILSEHGKTWSRKWKDGIQKIRDKIQIKRKDKNS